MSLIEDILNRIVAGAGESFLEDYAKETINDCLRWAEYEGKNPEEFLDKVCQFRLLERHLGENLLTHQFCKFDFVDDAEKIVEEFGWENTLSLLKEKGKSTDKDEEDMDFLAVFIISESLPGSNRVAEYIAEKIRERDDWKLSVRADEKGWMKHA